MAELAPDEEAAVNLLGAKHLKYARDVAKNSAALLPSRDGMSPRERLWESFAPVMRGPPEDGPPPAAAATGAADEASANAGDQLLPRAVEGPWHRDKNLRVNEIAMGHTHAILLAS
eukprot:SAG11_NODE_5080_length_1670_cov_1.956715_1_plen_116_part_00